MTPRRHCLGGGHACVPLWSIFNCMYTYPTPFAHQAFCCVVELLYYVPLLLPFANLQYSVLWALIVRVLYPSYLDLAQKKLRHSFLLRQGQLGQAMEGAGGEQVTSIVILAGMEKQHAAFISSLTFWRTSGTGLGELWEEGRKGDRHRLLPSSSAACSAIHSFPFPSTYCLFVPVCSACLPACLPPQSNQPSCILCVGTLPSPFSNSSLCLLLCLPHLYIPAQHAWLSSHDFHASLILLVLYLPPHSSSQCHCVPSPNHSSSLVTFTLAATFVLCLGSLWKHSVVCIVCVCLCVSWLLALFVAWWRLNRSFSLRALGVPPPYANMVCVCLFYNGCNLARPALPGSGRRARLRLFYS